MSINNNKNKLNFTLSDILIYSIFPLILLIMRLVPESLQKILNLNLYTFRFWPFLTNILIHFSDSHFISDISGKPLFLEPLLKNRFEKSSELFKDEVELRKLLSNYKIRKSLLNQLLDIGYGKDELKEIQKLMLKEMIFLIF